MALHRLLQKGRIALALKRPACWLIIPAEHAHYGAPPVAWWLAECLREVEPAHYVGLLSAARHWGSAHYALQATQVMVGTPRPPLTVGRREIRFFSKREVSATPTVTVNDGVSPWRVSTREATLLDLIRHQSAVGGLETVARVCADLAPALATAQITAALNALGQTPAAQRLGFMLDTLGAKRCANTVRQWLSGRTLALQPLTLDGNGVTERTSTVARQWSIRYCARQYEIIG